MAKSFTAAQRKKYTEEITERVKSAISVEIEDIQGYDGYFTSLQESILYSVSSAVNGIVDKALRDWEFGFERDEDNRLAKLNAEVKELRKEIKKYAAIKKLMDDAAAEVS
jgi:hypothetical protein